MTVKNSSLLHPLALILAALALPAIALAQEAPQASRAQVAEAAQDLPKLPAGPYEATWDSIKANYKTPDWFQDAKFGIMMHFGLYSVPAYSSEWYELHIFDNAGVRDWHVQHFGPLDKFGYKDFIPLFATKFDPDQWAALFKKSGAKYIIPTAEHHDGFSLWDSALNKYNAKAMGPKRDIVGELGAAVRKQGLKFGVSNHSMEHFTFVKKVPDGLKTDLADPEWADFYNYVDRSPERLVKFLHTWVLKNYELIDKYQPDMLWFDNGVNGRNFDPLKLAVAAYYYNRATEWGKQVSLSTKGSAYLAGSILDYEREGRAPKTLTDSTWQADDPIGEKFGYVEGMKLTDSGNVVRTLIANTAHNGNLLLNISPKGDGTIPDAQQQILLGVGKWLDINGDAIYGTRPWAVSEEGTNMHFTTKNGALYAIINNAKGGANVTVASLPKGYPPKGKIDKVELLGQPGSLAFTQDESGLHLQLPAELPSLYASALKIGMSIPSTTP